MNHSRRVNQNLAVMNEVGPPKPPQNHWIRRHSSPYFSSRSSLGSSSTSYDDGNDDESSYGSFSILGNSDDEIQEWHSNSAASGYNTSFSSDYSILGDSSDEEWNSAVSLSYPPSPLLSPNSSNQPFLEDNPEAPKPGLGGIMCFIAEEEEKIRKAFLNPFPRNVLLFGRHQVKPDDKNPPFSPPPPPGHPIILQFGTRDWALGGLGNEPRLCHDWPCVFATRWEPASPPTAAYSELIVQLESVPASEIRSHAVISPEGNAVHFWPLTFCRVHKNAGYLKLEDIQDSESYTRVDVNFPFAKVTHRYNDCILKFPPTHNKWIVFKENEGDDQVDRPDNDDEKKGFSPPPPSPPNLSNKKLDETGPSRSSSRLNPLDKFMKCCSDCGERLAAGHNVYIFSNMVSSFCNETCRYWHILEEDWQSNMPNPYGNADDQQWANPRGNTNKGKVILSIG